MDFIKFLKSNRIQVNIDWKNLKKFKKFSSLEIFLKDFGNLKDAEQVEKLHKILQPYLVKILERIKIIISFLVA